MCQMLHFAAEIVRHFSSLARARRKDGAVVDRVDSMQATQAEALSETPLKGTYFCSASCSLPASVSALVSRRDPMVGIFGCMRGWIVARMCLCSYEAER